MEVDCGGKVASPARRRECVRLLQAELGLSERRACRVVGQARSVQRASVAPLPEERDVCRRLFALSETHPSYGVRRLHAALKSEGWQVSYRRVVAICRREGIRATEKSRAPRPREVLRSTRPGEAWSCDLLYDEDREGRKLAWLAVLDECTRECLALTVHRSVESRDVISAFSAARGHCKSVGAKANQATARCDNAKVWRSQKVAKWCQESGITLRQSDRGSPWQNGVVEAFFGRLRAELLNSTEMADLAEARAEAAMWQRAYNTMRPHGALGYMPPEAYRRQLQESRILSGNDHSETNQSVR